MSNLIAQICTDNDQKKLNRLYETSPQYLTQHPALTKIQSLESFHLGIFKNDILIAAIPFIPSKSSLQKLWLTPMFTPFSGPVADRFFYENNPESERFWRDVWQAVVGYQGKLPDRVDMVMPPGVIDCRELTWNGWTASPRYNYLLEWEEDNAWWDMFENNARRQVKKARENEDLRDVVYNSSKTEKLQELWIKNANYQKLDASCSDTIESIGNWLHQLDSGFVVTIEDRTGKAHTAGLYGWDRHRVYYLAGASDPELRGTGAPSWLHARALEEIERRELPRVYDWVGANTPNIVTFKKSFSPTLEMTLLLQRAGTKSSLLQGIGNWRKS